MLKRFARLLFALTALAPMAAVHAAPETFETVLGNGMKVIVRPDHRAPVVMSQVWYRIGSVDESNGTTGISHVLEHMMFEAPARYRRASSRAG
jgi:zinc protease